MNNKQSIQFMNKVAGDIIKTKIEYEETMEEIMSKFYSIMRKHGIKQGTKTKGGGTLCNNFEWTMCKALFLMVIHDNLNMHEMLSGIPEDLKYY